MGAAARELLSLGPVGLQLTPGCAPTVGFEEFLARSGAPTTTHEGFCFEALRRPVWEGSELVATADSVHPPKASHVDRQTFFEDAADGCYGDTTIETMYPGFRLGSGDEIEQAMDLALPLAVDVSHVYIQLQGGVMTRRTWRRLQGYPHVREVHVSANDGTRDQHRPIEFRSFGLGWAIERSREHVPLVLESYMHKQAPTDRHEMVERLALAIGA